MWNDPANGGLDEVDQLRRVLDARAGLRPHVEHELAAVSAREEVLTEKGHQRGGRETAQEEHRDEEVTTGDQRGEQAVVYRTNPLEATLERSLQARERVARRTEAPVLRLHQIHGQRRHERPRQYVRREHGKDHRFGKRHEEIAGHAAQEEHRQEDDADGERRHQCGNGNLCGA